MGDVVDKRIGERLKKVREMLGLSLIQVSEQIGFNSYQILSNIEKGVRAVKVSELSKLCKIYSKDSFFFLQEEEPNVKKPLFAWRAKSDTIKAKQIEAKVDQILTDYHMLEQITGSEQDTIFSPWENNIEHLSFDNIEKKAEELIDAIDLGTRPYKNLVETLEEDLKIKILFQNLEGSGSAISTKGDYGYAIIIDSNEAPWRRNYNLAHELFHILAENYFPLDEIHPAGAEDKKPMAEQLADAFASALLIPRAQLKEALRKRVKDNKIQWVELIHLAVEFGVSHEALLWRLCNIRQLKKEKVDEIIESEEFKSLNKEVRGNTNKPADTFSDRFVLLALKALNEGKISKGKFCNIFNIKRAEFDSFLNSRGDLSKYSYGTEIQLDNT
ncbi:MAG: helix-turn-helix domain-containing protein [Candidatus Zixiibacteriota bacterium]